MRPQVRLSFTILLIAAAAAIAAAVVPAAAANAAVAQPPGARPKRSRRRSAPNRGQGADGGDRYPPATRKRTRRRNSRAIPRPPGSRRPSAAKSIGIPPGKSAQVGVAALIGTHWIKPDNYQWAKVAPDGSFTITGDFKPDARKALLAAVDRCTPVQRPPRRVRRRRIRARRRIAHQAGQDDRPDDGRSRRQAGQPASRPRSSTPTPCATMRTSRSKRIGWRRRRPAPARSCSMAPPEPLGVLLAANKLAPYYVVIDPRDADAFHVKMLAESRIKGRGHARRAAAGGGADSHRQCRRAALRHVAQDRRPGAIRHRRPRTGRA